MSMYRLAEITVNVGGNHCLRLIKEWWAPGEVLVSCGPSLIRISFYSHHRESFRAQCSWFIISHCIIWVERPDSLRQWHVTLQGSRSYHDLDWVMQVSNIFIHSSDGFNGHGVMTASLAYILLTSFVCYWNWVGWSSHSHINTVAQ